MDLELVAGISAVPVIIGVVQLAKMAGFPKKWSGFLAVGVGLVASFGYTYYSSHPAYTATVVGLGLGLSAAGLYSAVDAVRNKN